ncbi:MAG: hypothetical protein IKO47_12680 [Ruminococcus sp.]|nr:hypothetical protein [Ruminococcus sp.]
MIEQDTVKLLRECDSGAKMGVSAIDDVLGRVKSQKLRGSLMKSREENMEIAKDIQALLGEYHDEGKEPSAVIKGMAWIKTKSHLAVDSSDSTVADLMTDGCNMGIKSINKYFNQYKAADERSKDIAKRLIGTEERLAFELREFL